MNGKRSSPRACHKPFASKTGNWKLRLKNEVLASKLWDVGPRIRDYRPQDFDELWQLDQSCFAPGIAYSRFELMRYIRRRGAFTWWPRMQRTDYRFCRCRMSVPSGSERRWETPQCRACDHPRCPNGGAPDRGGYHSYGCCREPDVGSQLRRGLPGGRGQQPARYRFLQASRLQRASDCTAILPWGS